MVGRAKEFDRHSAPEMGIFAEINHAHPALAEFVNNAIMGNRLPDHARWKTLQVRKKLENRRFQGFGTLRAWPYCEGILLYGNAKFKVCLLIELGNSNLRFLILPKVVKLFPQVRPAVCKDSDSKQGRINRSRFANGEGTHRNSTGHLHGGE